MILPLRCHRATLMWSLMFKRKTKQDGRCARNYLIYRDFKAEDLVFEPDGRVPPDLLINGHIPVEVRRLKQDRRNAFGQQMPHRRTKAVRFRVCSAFFLAVAFRLSLLPVAAQNPSAVRFSDLVPDASATTLGPQYHGLDPEKAYSGAGSLVPGESTRDFLARNSTRLAFVLNDRVTFYYFEASQELQVIVRSFGATTFESVVDGPGAATVGSKVPTVQLRSNVTRLGADYLAQNAFGAVVAVSTLEITDYGVALKPISWISAGHPEIAFSVKVLKERRKSFGDSLRVLLIGHGTAPFRLSRTTSHSATSQAPSNSLTTERFVYIEPEELWLFDEVSGTVLAKVNQQFFIDTAEKEMELQFPLGLTVEDKCAQSKSGFLPPFWYSIDHATPVRGDGRLPTTIRARMSIVFFAPAGSPIDRFWFKINGRSEQPDWRSEKDGAVKAKELNCNNRQPGDRNRHVHVTFEKH